MSTALGPLGLGDREKVKAVDGKMLKIFQNARPTSPRGADGYGPAYGCCECGGSCHSQRECVLVGAALHRKLDPHKDMTDLVDVILRLLLWDWKEASVGEQISCLSYAPHCGIIAAGCKAGKFVFIDAQTGEKIVCRVKFDASSGPFGMECVHCVTFNSVGDTLVAGCYNGKIFLIDPVTGQVREPPLRGHSGWVRGVEFNPRDPQMLVSCANDRTIKVWNITSGACLSTFRGHSDWVRGVAFNPRDPQMLFSCSNDKTIKVWNIMSGVCLSTLSCGSDVNSFTISPDGQHIIAGCDDGVCIFSLKQQSQDFEILSECPLSCGSWVFSIAFKDNMIAAGCDNGKIKIFALQQTGKWGEIRSESPLTGHLGTVMGAAFSADGQWIISGSEDGMIRLWDAHPAAIAVSAA